MWSWWKNFRRFDATLRVLITQLVFAIALSTFSIMLTIVILISAIQIHLGEEVDHAPTLLIWTFGILAPITGTWLTAGFHHLPRWHVWLGWWCFLTFMLLAPVMISAAIGELPERIHDLRDRNNTIFWEGLKLIMLPGALVQGVIMTVALVGIPLGRVVLWLTGLAQVKIWRMRRRARRLGRVA